MGLPLCKCGCGKQVTKKGNRFLVGHWIRINHPFRGGTQTENHKRKKAEAFKRFYADEERSGQERLRQRTFKHDEKTKRKISEALKGKPRSKEHQRKISETQRGRKLSEETKLKISQALKGRQFSEETRRKISKALTGPKHPRWKGGLSRSRDTRKYRDWRLAVFKRDSYTCQECKRRGGYLHPHHIKSWADYPELRFEVDNGMTLCLECHDDLHPESDFLMGWKAIAAAQGYRNV